MVSISSRRLWFGCVRFSSSACVQSHSDYFSSCVSAIVERLYVLFLLTNYDDSDPRAQGPYWEHPCSCTIRIPVQPSSSFPCDSYWFFRWRAHLGIIKRYLGTEVCAFPPLQYCMITYGGRFRLAFNITLLIGGIFGVAAGGANSFVALAVLITFAGVGVAGSPIFSS